MLTPARKFHDPDHVDWENLNVPKFVFLESAFFFFECFLIHPLDLIRCKLQVTTERLSMRAILNVIKTLGVKGLYTAFSMDVLYIPGNVIYMVTYVYLKEFLQKLDNKYFGQKRAEKLQLQSINLQEQPHYQALWVTCCAAIVADIASILFFCPIEVAQQRMYLQSFNNVKKYVNNRDAFKTILKEEGILAFYKGLFPLSMNTIPASAAWWSVYETCKRNLHTFAQLRNEKNKPLFSSKLSQQTAIQTISGGIAGLVSTVLTNPLDVIRTRLQTEVHNPNAIHGQDIKRTFYMLKNIYQVEGARALFKGLGPRALQWSSISSLNAFLYETAVRLSRKQ